MPLVSDTSPVISFSAVRMLDLLPAIWGEVWIPPAVFREVVTDGEGWTNALDLQTAIKEGRKFVRRSLPELPAAFIAPPKLGTGEIEVIALALHWRMTALIDDRAARLFAKSQGLSVIGSLGVLAIAKRRRMIPLAEPLVKAMRAAGIRFDDKLVEEFLRELGER